MPQDAAAGALRQAGAGLGRRSERLRSGARSEGAPRRMSERTEAGVDVWARTESERSAQPARRRISGAGLAAALETALRASSPC